MKNFKLNLTLIAVAYSLIASVSTTSTQSYESSFDTTSPSSSRNERVNDRKREYSSTETSRFRPFQSLTGSLNHETENVVAASVNDAIPTNIWIPTGLDFTCKSRVPGFYTDPSPESKCQVYHMCMPDGRKYSMLCGIGTVFNQLTFVCDHWYNYKCSDAISDYKRNDELWNEFLQPEEDNSDPEYEENESQVNSAEEP